MEPVTIAYGDRSITVEGKSGPWPVHLVVRRTPMDGSEHEIAIALTTEEAGRLTRATTEALSEGLFEPTATPEQPDAADLLASLSAPDPTLQIDAALLLAGVGLSLADTILRALQGNVHPDSDFVEALGQTTVAFLEASRKALG